MSVYIPQGFTPGEMLKAEQLNYIEQGIAKILPAIEAGEAKQLVTDTEGNLIWEKKVLDYTIEEQVLFEETELTGERVQTLSTMPKLKVEENMPITITINGQSYETTTFASTNNSGINAALQELGMSFNIHPPGASSTIMNLKGNTGTFSATVKAKKYQKIDSNYLPNPAISGTGFNSINLTNNYGVAEGIYSVVAQNGQAKGLNSFSANYSYANNDYTFANGFDTRANGIYSHAEGFRTTANGNSQHVEGKCNIEDTEDKYAHIIGNGTSNDARSNAYTLDWSGNGWFAGDVEGNSMIVKSSTEGSAKRFRLTVDDSGTISATEIV